jgi:hypothetical protein
MGYFINDIANETKTPAKVSLSGNPNFIRFESKEGVNKPVEISIDVIGTGYYLDDSDPNNQKFINVTEFKILEAKTNITHAMRGTSDISEITEDTFYIGPQLDFPVPGWPAWELYKTAESLMNALRQNSFIGNNFDISLPPVQNPDGTLRPGKIIKLKSKGSGNDYAFGITATDTRLYDSFLNIDGDPENTTSGDTISEGNDPVEIQLDIYSDTGVFLGENDKPNDSNAGTYIKTLSKSYANAPVWFDVNVLGAARHSTDFLNSEGWINTGTVRDFRFIAKRFVNDTGTYENTIFYYSNILYMMTGYKRGLEANDLSEYIYNTVENNIAKPLSNQPLLTHIKGQTQYFNFILSDPDRGVDLGASEYNIGIMYRLYSQSKKPIATVVSHEQNRKLFNIVNTIQLDIDNVIEEYGNIGYVEACLCRSGEQASESSKFNILPECLHKVNDFAFLNALGGWSSFNFPGTETTDFKASVNTIYKTQTPSHTISSEIESVYAKETEEQFTVQTMPIRKDVCDWLKELSSSVAVYELATKRYIVVDELNIKTETKDDLFRLEMKYHYSDRYNNLIV